MAKQIETVFRESEHYTLAALTEASLAAYEQRYGIRFPASLRQALLKVNGGCFQPGRFRIDGFVYEYSLNGFNGVPAGVVESGRSLYCVQENTNLEDILPSVRNVAGDPRKLFVFDDNGHSYYALNWNGRAIDNPSVCDLYCEGDVSLSTLAENWDEFMSFQYEGDETSSVIYGAGWEGFRIEIQEEFKDGAQGTTFRNICGVKDDVLRLQAEETSPSGVALYERTWTVSGVKLSLGYSRETRTGSLGISGSGESKKSERRSEDSKWTNEDVCQCDSVRSRSLDTLWQLFQQLEAKQNNGSRPAAKGGAR